MGTIWITSEGTYLTDHEIISSYQVDKINRANPAKFMAGMGKREVEFALATANYFQAGLDVEVREGTKEEFDAWVASELAADRAKQKGEANTEAAEEEPARRDAEEYTRIEAIACKDLAWRAAWKEAKNNVFDAGCKVGEAERVVERAEGDFDPQKLEEANARLEKAQAADAEAVAAKAKLWDQAVEMAKQT